MRNVLRISVAAVLACGAAAIGAASEPEKPGLLASATTSDEITLPEPSLTLPRTAPIEAPAIAAPPVPPQPPAEAAPAPAAAPPAPAVTTAAPPAATGHPLAGELRARIAALPALSAKADKAERDERAALLAFYGARGEQPLWIGETALNAAGKALAGELARADDWGLKGSDFDVPAIPPGAAPAVLADAELKLGALALKYARHARGGRMDPAQLSNYIDRKPPLLEPAAVLAGLAGAAEADAYLRKLHPQHPQFERLRQLYVAMRAGKLPEEPAPEAEAKPADAKGKGKYKTASAAPVPPKPNARKVMLNMEMWRWMPEDLGATYVQSNIPEFMLRVVRDGKIVHAERIITGKVENQTPIFSDEMETIVFHPFWGVPDSIKVKELLPGLLRGGGMLEKNGLRIASGNRDIDPSTVDWRTTDIRNFHVYQPPGGSNVLGVVKFLFPNKHQVYMHDTPSKSLFNSERRTFSHGCMRVRNPVRLAEVLLEQDKGWDTRRVATLINGGPQNNNVHLARKIPVHVTYFTAWVDDDGKAHFRPDVYGHEERIQMGLDGKAHLIVKKKEDLGPIRAEVVSRLAETRPVSGPQNWLKAIFGNF